MYGNSNQDIINRLNQAKPVEDRDPFLKEGQYTLCVQNFGEFHSKKHGPAVGGNFVVVQSTNPEHQPGSRAFNAFYVNRAPSFPGDQQELDRLVNFCGTLKGATDMPACVQASREMLDPEFQGRQLARGTLITCTVTKGTSAKTGKAFYEKAWAHVPNQTPEQRASYRAKVESAPGFQEFVARQAPAPQPAPAQYAQPAPQGAWAGQPQATPSVPAPAPAPNPWGGPQGGNGGPTRW